MPAVVCTVKLPLTPLVKPPACAVSCFVPEVSMRRFVKVTVPLPAAVPMSSVVVLDA